MEQKTKVMAEEGQHDILIQRDFDLPVELLFLAHTDPELFGQWMSHEYGTTRMVKLECRNHGGWRFETTDGEGKLLFAANGVIHELVPDQRIVRTFEMENSGFPAQLEFLEFESIGKDQSRLSMQQVFKTIELRDQLLKMPFAHGLSMAHDRLEFVIQQQRIKQD